MKRITALFLILTLLLGLTACTSETEAPETTATETSALSFITNVDDLLSSIQPGATLLLAEGTFQLDSAADYGNSTSPYYSWVSLGLGDYELQLHDVDGLTIQGAGEKTRIVTTPASVNVLSLKNCRNVRLEGMTIGHTERAEACEGGVIRLERCTDSSLKGLNLYGCGSLGVLSYLCQGLSIQGCTIYECSIGGVQLSESQDVTIQNSTFHSLGGTTPVFHVFDIYGGENITVSNCVISNNYVQNLICVQGTGAVTFQGNEFTGNRVSSSAFYFQQEGVVLADNLFEDDFRNWYAGNSVPAVDLEGNPLIFDEPETETTPVTPGTPNPVSTGEQTVVRVKTADEFLKAIASDTCIILESEIIDLSTAQSYLTAQAALANSNDFQPIYEEYGAPYYWVDNHDGPSLVIFGVSNLTIRSESEDRKAHTLSAVPRYANVLTFENCSAITLENFTAGHTIEPGYCVGGVLQFRNCENILVNNCGLFGCGTIGVDAISSRCLQVVNCEIYECSYNAIQLSSCENVAISGTAIRDIGDEVWGPSPYYSFHDSRGITLDGQDIDGNYVGS